MLPADVGNNRSKPLVVGRHFALLNVRLSYHVVTNATFNVTKAAAKRLIKLILVEKYVENRGLIVNTFVLSFAIQVLNVKLFHAKPKF